MKVIRDGRVQRRNQWWHGEHVECFCCGRLVELEVGDEAARKEMTFEPHAADRAPEWVIVHCPCGGRPGISRSQAKLRAEKRLHALVGGPS